MFLLVLEPTMVMCKVEPAALFVSDTNLHNLGICSTFLNHLYPKNINMGLLYQCFSYPEQTPLSYRC